MVHTCNPSMPEAEARGLLHSEFHNSLGCEVRPYLGMNRQDLTLLGASVSSRAMS